MRGEVSFSTVCLQHLMKFRPVVSPHVHRGYENCCCDPGKYSKVSAECTLSPSRQRLIRGTFNAGIHLVDDYRNSCRRFGTTHHARATTDGAALDDDSWARRVDGRRIRVFVNLRLRPNGSGIPHKRTRYVDTRCHCSPGHLWKYQQKKMRPLNAFRIPMFGSGLAGTTGTRK